MLIVAGGSFLSLTKISNSYTQTVERNLTNYALVIGSQVGAQYFERYGDVQAFAVNKVLRDMDISKIPSALDDYVRLYLIYDVILVVDTQGHPLASNIKDSNGKEVNFKALQKMNFKETDWFKAVMSGHTTDDTELGFSGTYFEDFMEDPITSAAFDEPRYGSSFSSAVRDSHGNVVGVITNRAHPKWFETDLNVDIKDSQRNGMKNTRFTLINGKGKIIFDYLLDGQKEVVLKRNPELILKKDFSSEHPGSEQAMNGTEGIVQFVDKNGTDIVSSFHHISNSKWPKSLGWSVILTTNEHDALEPVIAAKNIFYILLLSCMLMGILIAVGVSFGISRSVSYVTSVLSTNGSEVSIASEKIASASTQLSQASTEQAAAIQETVAAVDEISAMVEKNAEAANRSKETSALSRQMAEQGRRNVENMSQAIEDINSSNNAISEQMDDSNRQLSEITQLISDIGSKTKVINEIVFQTKLLSFNASVEAARAGEYGKGFAVVAEEVGNLAEMSGTAAKEITSLLDESTRKVESIVSETKSRVERAMIAAREKVTAGNTTAKECNRSLEEILRYVQEVDGLVSEIAVASNEQSIGIREISKAIGQMDTVTQQNSSIAHASSVSADQLREQATQLNNMVRSLSKIVLGNNKGTINEVREEELSDDNDSDQTNNTRPKLTLIKGQKNHTHYNSERSLQTDTEQAVGSN